MLAAGHVQTREDAFRRFLEQGGPAYVPRQGVSPEEVIAVIHQSHGLASVAHPGVSRTDGRLADLAKAGLDAIEVRHPDHDAETEARYRGVARELRLLVTGGSDYHGDTGHRTAALGAVTPARRRLRRATRARDDTHEPVGPPDHERLRKQYQALRPLRVRDLTIGAGERVALAGLDLGAAEVLVNLVTGASVPDEGEVIVLDHSTRAISDGDEWLASLDRFGIVSPRAVLLDGATLLQNLVMPFTLEIDPIPAAVEATASALGIECGIAADRLTAADCEPAGGGSNPRASGPGGGPQSRAADSGTSDRRPAGRRSVVNLRWMWRASPARDRWRR